MTNLRIKTKSIALLILSACLVTFLACDQQDPISPSNIDNSDSDNTILYKGKPAKEHTYPMSSECTFLWVNPQKGFQGGQLKVDNGTTFFFDGGSLTPPAGWTDDRINITMTVDMDSVNNEMVFTFGPSGCHFNPNAEVWLVYKDLGLAAPVLYYIDENGNYIPQNPDYIDYQGNKMLISIDHFSRYAIGTEN